MVSTVNSAPVAADNPVVASRPAPAAVTSDSAPAATTSATADESADGSENEIVVASASPTIAESVVRVQPPPPQVEVVGAAPGPEYVWMPGIWTWQGNWVWISGRWVQRPRPDARWVTGHWTEHANGWVWVRGYWR